MTFKTLDGWIVGSSGVLYDQPRITRGHTASLRSR